MGQIVSTALRDKHLRNLDELAQRTWGERCELAYVFKDHERAGVISRWLRKEARARGHPLTIRQMGERVFIWKSLPPDDEDRAMMKALDSLSYEIDGKPAHHFRPV